MSKLTNEPRSKGPDSKGLATRRVNRRTLLKGAAAAAAVMNFMGWAGYKFDPVFAAFTKATGIKMNFIEQPEQDTMLAQCKLALQTGGVDCVEPTLDRLPAWVSGGIIQPWDTSKLVLSNYIDGVPGAKAGDAGEVNGKRYFIPSVWGTEALLFNAKEAPLTYGTASLADLFDPKYEGKVTLRAHSSLAAMGRILDGQGKLPKPFLDSYKDEATMRQVWDVVLAEAIKHKSNVAQFWASENDAQGAFRTNGCVIGLCWDGTGLNMAPEGYGFVAPKEGAFAWSQGFFALANAKNLDQAHEWAKWISTAEGSAAWATVWGANPVGKGGIELLDAKVKTFYAAAYPGDALSKLWWWPAQDAWFLKLRGEYADKWKAA